MAIELVLSGELLDRRHCGGVIVSGGTATNDKDVGLSYRRLSDVKVRLRVCSTQVSVYAKIEFRQIVRGEVFAVVFLCRNMNGLLSVTNLKYCVIVRSSVGANEIMVTCQTRYLTEKELHFVFDGLFIRSCCPSQNWRSTALLPDVCFVQSRIQLVMISKR